MGIVLGEYVRGTGSPSSMDPNVGDIETAAGLQPRRGALYHYFSTKQELLEAAIQTYLTRIESGLRQMEELPGHDLRSEAVVIGRWFLAEVDAEHYLNRILEQDGGRLTDIRHLVLERIIDAGHRRVEQFIRRRVGERRPALDTEALAAVIIGPLANHRRVGPTGVRPWTSTTNVFSTPGAQWLRRCSNRDPIGPPNDSRPRTEIQVAHYS